MDEVRRAVEAVDRQSRARIVAALARRFGDLDLAEDALQDAMAQALHSWPTTGVPTRAEAWLHTTARNKAIDVLRRQGVLADKLELLRIEQAPPVETAAVPDDRLELLFVCAHPVMKPEDRVAMTLRFVVGLTTVEVARALLVPVPTMQQRIVRAKKRIRVLGISFDAPAPEHLADRLVSVLRVVYLLYAEGFARSVGDAHIRDDLTSEAIRLAHVLHSVWPQDAEVAAVLALLLLTEARRPARTDSGGRPIALADQDRSRWQPELIAQGLELAQTAAATPGAGVYAIQAAIAAVHAEATAIDTTDWAQIAVLYRMLEQRDPGPVVRLGHAVAIGRAHGLRVGLDRLDELATDPVLSAFRPFHIARALTLEELGDHRGAAQAYRRAIELSGNDAEDAFLAAALAGVGG